MGFISSSKDNWNGKASFGIIEAFMEKSDRRRERVVLFAEEKINIF